jgi:hypothetical protein
MKIVLSAPLSPTILLVGEATTPRPKIATAAAT